MFISFTILSIKDVLISECCRVVAYRFTMNQREGESGNVVMYEGKDSYISLVMLGRGCMDWVT
jgi:hypothetical protein